MQTEQILFEGRNCPVKQKFVTRQEYIKQVMKEREENKRLDRMAKEAEFMDRYERGLTF